ncbi:hypothetical protein [Siminovitchia fordii]|uniref:Uncharacterized protein n=1 Tax=Siminovitchia fordii TaxID=254759 RepID=A0ABQ4KBV9_9BACI|nr:hypothetical protein [Siminovitchia fordii]GIN22623.1 hypothetical protein J1TS3_37570 [Siminovitchia fordii]
MQAILNRVTERENKRLLNDVMPLYVSAMCLKNFGFKTHKHTYGRKEKGIYIYPKNDKEKVFLSLETFKSKHTDDEMEKIVVDLLKTAI